MICMCERGRLVTCTATQTYSIMHHVYWCVLNKRMKRKYTHTYIRKYIHACLHK